MWEALATKKDAPEFAEAVKSYAACGDMSPYVKLPSEEFSRSMWSLLCDALMTPEEVLERSLQHHYRVVSGQKRYRCIRHLLNRLAYERSELGEVVRYEGTLTPVIIQTFLREHGAEKPKASKTALGFKVVSPVDLPLHIAEGSEVELSSDAWRDKMQASGYEVPKPKPKKPGIINFQAQAVRIKRHGTLSELPQIHLTNAEYMAIHSDYRSASFSACGTFKVRVCVDPANQTWRGGLFCVFLADRKEHPAPDSPAVIVETEACA